ncbi:MAG: LysR family transcriptional regulator [Pseudomonadota bacterium]
MELTQLRTFVAVSQSGGFASAADTLNVTPSTVTRAIANLEASLGVRLFQRTTRSVSLTEAGEGFLRRISPALDEIAAAADDACKGSKELSGVLRVGASVSFGQVVIAPNLSRFCGRHQNLTVDLVLSDNLTDLIANRIDVAVRHGDLADSSLIAQRLARVSYRVVASPDYLSANGGITHPKDLAHHSCLTFPYAAFRSCWRFRSGRKKQDVKIDPTIRVSNPSALATCVKSGMGLALLADWMVDRDLADGSLVKVLPDWIASGVGADTDPALWIVTPSRAFVPEKTRAFIEFLRKTISQ